MGVPGGSADSWVDQLVVFALQDGVDTFLITGDDPRVIALFAEEVAPAVRAAVAAGRASGVAGPAV